MIDIAVGLLQDVSTATTDVIPTTGLGLAAVIVTQFVLLMITWINTRQTRNASHTAEAAKEQLQNGQTTNFRQQYDATSGRLEGRMDNIEKHLGDVATTLSEVRGTLQSIHTRVERVEKRRPFWM